MSDEGIEGGEMMNSRLGSNGVNIDRMNSIERLNNVDRVNNQDNDNVVLLSEREMVNQQRMNSADQRNVQYLNEQCKNENRETTKVNQ